VTSPLPYLDSAVPLAIAHRGFSRQGLENSLQAFSAAVDLGFRYVETDVHTTADGVAVVFHDATLERVSTGTGAIAALPYTDVAKARIGGTEPIPTLVELVSALPDTSFNLDVKDAASIAPVAAVIEEYGLHERVCVASFSDRRRRAVLKRLSRRTTSSAGMASTAAFVLLGPVLPRPLLRRLLSDVDCFQVPLRFRFLPVLTPRFLARAHGVGIKVHVWTVNDPALMRRLLDLGVDGVMTDRADLLADVMRDRGHWPGS
jgi:glycerophosphoryl diester phosphodiesterase